MRIIRYLETAQNRERWGILDPDGTVYAADGEPFRDLAKGAAVGPASEVRLLAPVAPSKIVCVGRNYAEHAAELGNEVPKEPLLFLKPPSSIVASGDDVLHPAISKRLDHEAELALVIGAKGHKVSKADAMSLVGGYTVANDVTARDIQKSDPQWTRGKGWDTFCPIGPWVDTDFDASDVRVTAAVNGEIRQDGRTKDFIFDIPFLIEYITAFTTLVPGDVILTGTPEGVGPVQPGDTMTIAVEALGEITNPVIAEK